MGETRLAQLQRHESEIRTRRGGGGRKEEEGGKPQPDEELGQGRWQRSMDATGDLTTTWPEN